MQNKKSKSLEWYYKHREEQIKKNREWKANNKDKVELQHKAYWLKNRDEILKKKKEYREKNKSKIMEYRRKPEVKEKAKLNMRDKREKTNHAYDRKHYQENKEKIKAYYKMHSQIPEVKSRRNLMARIRNRKNPRSNRSDPPELQCHKNNVRAIMKQTCQWYGCGLTFREAPIHVHHIFPVNEYPEFEMEERYMILYCANHHSMFHRYRGDWYAEMINPNYQQNEFEPLIRNEDLD